MSYRVILNGITLSNNPRGFDTFTTEFVRDNELFGIYSISSFDLVFVGDGFCILRDSQLDLSICDIPIVIQQWCNNSWSNIFDGIIETSSIELDYSISEATCEIIDNSPLSLLSRNADVTVDIESNKDIYGNLIDGYVFPFTTSIVKDLNGNNNNASLATWDVVLKNLISAITGKKVNITSNYLNTLSEPEIWRITFSLVSLGAAINSITIQFKDFQGNTHLVGTPYSSGNAAIQEISYNLLDGVDNSGVGLEDEKEDLQFSYDVRKFYGIVITNLGLTRDFYSTLPIEIESITIDDGGAGNTATFSKIQDFVDGGNIPSFATYRSLKNLTSSDFTTTFKEIITELHKMYNVYFVATYNNGEIDIIIEDEKTILNTTNTFTFNNPQKLKSKFDSSSVFNQISLGDASSTRMQQNINLTSVFCGIKNEFDATNSFIFGASDIQSDMIEVYDESKADRKYILSNYGSSLSSPLSIWVYDNGSSLNVLNNWAVNMFDSNWHKLYRHFSKLISNIIGLSPYSDYDSTGYSVNVTNTSRNKLFMNYEFEESMTRLQFNSLVDNIFDKALLKIPNQTNYKEGIIKSVEYNQTTGKALITILGE
jgi:hypothetical protein